MPRLLLIFLLAAIAFAGERWAHAQSRLPPRATQPVPLAATVAWDTLCYGIPGYMPEPQLNQPISGPSVGDVPAGIQLVATRDDVAAYTDQHLQAERQAASRHDTLIRFVDDLSTGLRSERDRPGLQRYALLRLLVLLREASLPDLVPVQQRRRDLMLEISGQLLPLLGADEPAYILARTEIVAALADAHIAYARDALAAAVELDRDASRLERRLTEVDTELQLRQRTAAEDPDLRGAARVRREQQMQQLQRQSEQLRAEVQVARDAATVASASSAAPLRASRTLAARAMSAYIAQARWQIDAGYPKPAGRSLDRAGTYARILEDAEAKRTVDELLAEQRRQLLAEPPQ